VILKTFFIEFFCHHNLTFTIETYKKACMFKSKDKVGPASIAAAAAAALQENFV